MELEAIVANGTELAVKEFLSVKSDGRPEDKKDLIDQLIKTGEYHLPKDKRLISRTKQVVDIQLEFLKE